MKEVIKLRKIWTDQDINTLTELYNKGEDIRSICSIMGRTYCSITSKAVCLGLTTKNIKPNNPNYKAVCQEYDWCYDLFINKGLSHQEMAVIAGCKTRTIEKWCTEIHKLDIYKRMKSKTLNIIQHDLVIGSLLGDGHIDKREKYPLFIVSHAENQKDYLYYKYEIMKDMCRMTPTKYDGGYAIFNDKKYNRQDSYRFNTGTYQCLDYYRKLTKLELVNMLNEYSFSIWMLDDASYSSSNCLWQLCSAMMNEQENSIALEIIHKKFNITGKILKDRRYIQFDIVNSKRINDIVLKNIPNNLDVVRYKLLEKKVS
jgi:hypothetical protein